MPFLPHLKGGTDVPVTDGGTGASDAATARINLDALNEAAHDLLDHSGLPGVGDLFIADHEVLDHSSVPFGRYLLLNSEYTADAAQSAGLVLNVDPAATSFAISGIASNIITVGAGDPSAVLAAGDFILVQNPATRANAGIYEVQSTTVSSITISVAPAQPFSKAAITDDPSIQGTVVGVSLAVMRAGASGEIESGFGNSNASLVYSVNNLSHILSIGNTSGANDIVMSAGQGVDAATTLFLGVSTATSITIGKVSIGTAIPGWLNIGAATSAVASGDIAASGGGTRSLLYDASVGQLGLFVGTPVFFAASVQIQTEVEGSQGFWNNTVFTASDPTDGAVFMGQRGRGTKSSPGGILSGDLVARWIANGFTTTGANSTCAQISFSATENWTGTTNAGGAIDFYTAPNAAGTLSAIAKRWSIANNGHLLGGSDNAYDIGASGATRPRTAYLGTSLNVGSGITPSTANGDAVIGDGTRTVFFDASDGTLRVTNTANSYCQVRIVSALGTAGRSLLTLAPSSDAADGEGGWQAYSSTWVQTTPFDLPNSTWIFSNTNLTNGISISSQSAAGALRFGTNSLLRWQIDGANGHLLGGIDNTYDIGAAGATRPRFGYFGTGVNVGTTTAAAASGDVAASDGTNELLWDASANKFTINKGGSGPTLEFNDSLNTYLLHLNAGAAVFDGMKIRVEDGVSAGAHLSLSAGTEPASGQGAVLQLNAASASVEPNSLLLFNRVNGPIRFATNNIQRWRIGSSGAFAAATDNSYDIGNSGADRPRTAYIGTSLNVGDGITPSTANGAVVAGDSVSALSWNPSNYFTRVDTTANVANGFVAFTTSTGISARSTFAASVGGTTAQFGIASASYTADPAFGQGQTYITSAGTSAGILLNAVTAGPIAFAVSNITRWTVTSTGHFVTGADNTYDLGASGATRPRTAYLGTSLNVGNGITPSTANGDIVAGDSTYQFTWDASIGAVRIGSSAAAIPANTALYIPRESAFDYVRLRNADTDANGGQALIFQRTRGTLASQAAVSVNDQLGAVVGQQAIDGSNIATAASILFRNDGAVSGTSSPGRIVFQTTPSSSLSASDRWYIDSVGHLLGANDNASDIGAAGTYRPRSLYLGTSLNVGNGITPSTANGDIVAGDGTRALEWDASTGVLSLTGAGAGLNTAGDVVIGGDLTVNGTTTTVNSEIQTADNFILLNSEYTSDAAQSSGLVLNIDPAATSFSISGIATNIITVVSGDPSAVLSAGDFILIQNPATAGNAGVYEVLSTTTSTVTIDTTPAETFSGTSLLDDATAQGTIVGVGLAVIRTNSSGEFETAFGASAPLTPYFTAGPSGTSFPTGAQIQRTVEANTATSGAPNILTDVETFKVLTNEGATADNYHTLPSAVVGLTYTFYQQDNTDKIRVTAGAGDTIRLGGTVSATAGYAESTAQGDALTLVAINATEWVALSVIGTWTVV